MADFTLKSTDFVIGLLLCRLCYVVRLKAWLHCRLFMSRRRRCVEFAVKRLNGLNMYLSVLQSSIRSSNDLFPLAWYCTALNSAFYWSQVTECLLCCFLRRHLTSWTSRFIWQVPFLETVWSNRPDWHGRTGWSRLATGWNILPSSNWKIAISINNKPSFSQKKPSSTSGINSLQKQINGAIYKSTLISSIVSYRIVS